MGLISPQSALLQLIGKALQQGLPVGVAAGDPQHAQWLDDFLWKFEPDSFLPHGVAGGEFDADQPVLIGVGPADANGAELLMVMSGQVVDPPEQFAQIFDFADGRDPQSLAASRERYRFYRERGCVMEYWAQESGRWVLKNNQSPPNSGDE
ncbi:putative DNA polymerase III subunit chi [Magnetofaba australis IT-1]|uniref:Putative DNA polymerase III subunit chi n=1 Tax=Magnetofaba australis IT-1 TaxID=1434232 RepID=A0A1Y2K4J4_9PROT|nr:putative DNA polymerase III subunit chi [Magnetofaba australis IT-1]